MEEVVSVEEEEATVVEDTMVDQITMEADMEVEEEVLLAGSLL